MEKRMFCSLVLLVVIFVQNGGAFAGEEFRGGTKEEAIAYIEKSMADQQIREWVEKEYFSEKLFLMAVNLAPEETVKEVAVTFSDFQRVGGDMKDASGPISIVVFVLALGVLIATLSAL
jgi:hypothetical protein